MNKLTTIAAILLVVIFASCQKSMIHGKGETITQIRTVGTFTSAQVNGSIEMHIIKGAEQKVEVKGYSNLVNVVETNLVNNRLNIKFQDEFFNIRNNNVQVYITVPALDGAATNGSGGTSIEGFTNGGTISANVNGSGRITISNSTYDNAVLEVNGSGEINAAGLSSKNVDATIHGSGNIETTCSQVLKGSISGSGNIKYWGNPAVDVKISGSGRVKKQ
jgi:uncharacterized protein involved in outer membrane biogenesis